jgi:hypothetical protein
MHLQVVAIRESKWDDSSQVTLLRRSILFSSAYLVVSRARILVAAQDGSLQPFLAQIRRLVQAMKFLGQPFTTAEENALSKKTRADALAVLDRRSLIEVHINPEARVSVTRGAARAELVEQGWRCFLVKVVNEGGVTASLRAHSPQARNVYDRAKQMTGPSRPPQTVTAADVGDRWLEMTTFDDPPMTSTLSGAKVEYRVIELYSRDRGQREAMIGFSVGAASQDLAPRDVVPVLFKVLPSSEVTIRLRDEHGHPTIGSFLIRDPQDRVYPALNKRLAPDFYFQPQIYRADGETIRLPAGDYSVEYSRGPEYLAKTGQFAHATGSQRATWSFQLERWINPADYGWYSGDHHIHASGCMHYQSPTEGVLTEQIVRHIQGEALNVGAVLTWGSSYYYQKRFFEGKVSKLSTSDTLIRYDLEVSGFPSSHSGHLVLLRLTEQDFPGTTEIEDWPSWTLPIAQWAKGQGAVVGFAHTALGLDVESTELPNYDIPKFDSVGANEVLVDVTHGAIDFLSLADTPAIPELNVWYHLLNTGFRIRASGETDFPCMSDERVGAGRSYVQLDNRPEGDAGYDAWVAGIKSGRAYASDGRSHLMDFRVNGILVGTGSSEVNLAAADSIKVSASVAARLAEAPIESIRSKSQNDAPYWHVERARSAASRQVRVELVVNGIPLAGKLIVADGSVQPVEFEVAIGKSSWVALRILPSSHTNPIFVLVGGAPIRASRRSTQWCLDCVNQLWRVKSPQIRDFEREAAEAAYQFSRAIYQRILRDTKT